MIEYEGHTFYNLGAIARMNGLPRDPKQDPNFMLHLSEWEGDESEALFGIWLSGWDSMQQEYDEVEKGLKELS
jgi:hypothetical protein